MRWVRFTSCFIAYSILLSACVADIVVHNVSFGTWIVGILALINGLLLLLDIGRPKE